MIRHLDTNNILLRKLVKDDILQWVHILFRFYMDTNAWELLKI